MYKFLEHTADVKFIASGNSLEKAFSESAMAMRETMLKGKMKIKEKIKKKISVSGKDNESLLYNFLEEFLFLLDSERFLLSKIKKIKITGNRLEADIVGDNAESYEVSNDVKAVTYNQMKIEKNKSKYTIQVVLDV